MLLTESNRTTNYLISAASSVGPGAGCWYAAPLRPYDVARCVRAGGERAPPPAAACVVMCAGAGAEEVEEVPADLAEQGRAPSV